MPKGKTAAAVLGAAVLALVVYVGVNLSRFTGIYQDREPVLVGACDTSWALPGAEDMVAARGGLLVSASDRGGRQPGFRDGIYWLPDAGGEPRLVSRDAPAGFHPHGLSLLERADGPSLLYAISHEGTLYEENEAGHSVEVFEVGADGALTHLRSLTHPLIRSPNDLAVLAEDVFFVTNDWKHLGGVMRQLENALALPLTDVVLYDRGEAVVADDGLNFANGIALAPDHRTLWVNEIRGRRVRGYDVNPETLELTRFAAVPLATAPDNVTIASDGSLLIAGIPEAFRFQRHAAGKEETAPAQILRVEPLLGEKETIFYDENGRISGATVGFEHNGYLFIGTAFGETLLRCPMPRG